MHRVYMQTFFNGGFLMFFLMEIALLDVVKNLIDSRKLGSK